VVDVFLLWWPNKVLGSSYKINLSCHYGQKKPHEFHTVPVSIISRKLAGYSKILKAAKCQDLITIKKSGYMK